MRCSNAHDFEAGDCLGILDHHAVKVIKTRRNALELSSPILKDRAGKLCKICTFTTPEDVAANFFQGWNSFWKRDDPQLGVPDEAMAIIRGLPAWGACPFNDLSLPEWRNILRKSRTCSMRGADAWSIAELRLLSDAASQALLDIFRAVEHGGKWPPILLQSFVILLRKVDGSVSWEQTRPITVLSGLYRLWARMRTAVLVDHCVKFSLPLVSPRLPTSVMWTYNSLVLQEASVGARPVAGCVFDIVKAFNLLCRSIVFALCEHFGFPGPILHAWKSALHSLGRTVLINGWIGGFQVSSTGYPEGDPLSILAMYVMSWSAASFTMRAAPVLFSCYADNWEIIGDRPCHVATAVDQLQQFAGAMRLSFAPEKCWSWAFGPDARKQVAAITWLGASIPCKRDAVNLGVQTLYTRRKKVALRNKRFLEGKRRCARIKRLPTGRRFRARLIKQGVWTQALHGAEIMKLGKTVFADLRTAMAAAVKAPHGASPWLVGAATTLGCYDPEFQVAFNRVLNYRNFCRHVPIFADRLVHSMATPNPKMSGAGSLLHADLLKLGFVHCFRDSFQWQGVKLHLGTSTSRHVRRVMELAWGCYIAPKIAHRKSLQDLQSIWIQSAPVHASLSEEELAYMFAVQVGASFTADVYRHWSPDDRCKLCGQFDSREHRFTSCPALESVRDAHSQLFALWPRLPNIAKLYCLQEIPQSLLDMLAFLDRIPWPVIPRTDVVEPWTLFTDASACFPQRPWWRLAAAAVIQVPHFSKSADFGEWELFWKGALPTSNQNVVRAEMLAGYVAFSAATKVSVYSDCKVFVDGAQAMASVLQ